MRPTLPDPQAFAAVCEAHGVQRLWLFGSALTDEWNPETSDFDFLVDYDPTFNRNKQTVASLYLALTNLVGGKIDLINNRAVRNPYFAQSVRETAQVMYGA